MKSSLHAFCACLFLLYQKLQIGCQLDPIQFLQEIQSMYVLLTLPFRGAAVTLKLGQGKKSHTGFGVWSGTVTTQRWLFAKQHHKEELTYVLSCLHFGKYCRPRHVLSPGMTKRAIIIYTRSTFCRPSLLCWNVSLRCKLIAQATNSPSPFNRPLWKQDAELPTKQEAEFHTPDIKKHKMWSYFLEWTAPSMLNLKT